MNYGESSGGFRHSKRLGQNFLTDTSIPPMIVSCAGVGEGDGVIEIGPGMGALTVPLCEKAKKVVAVELDHGLLPFLSGLSRKHENLIVINADILKLNISDIIKTHFEDMPVKVCANLPYYITTPIITALLESRAPIDSITVMVQKEVAVRLCAIPGGRDCGAVSYCVSYFSDPRMEFDVPPGAFTPSPKVTSSVITFNMLKIPRCAPKNESLMFKLIKAAFMQRRKTLKNALTAAGYDKALVEMGIESVAGDLNIRGERLSLLQFGELSDYLSAQQQI